MNGITHRLERLEQALAVADGHDLARELWVSFVVDCESALAADPAKLERFRAGAAVVDGIFQYADLSDAELDARLAELTLHAAEAQP